MRKEAEKRKAEAIENLRVRVRDNRVKFCFAFWPIESLLNSFNFFFFVYCFVTLWLGLC